VWYKHLDGTLRRFGFHQSEHEHTICCWGDNGGWLIVEVYVDDLIITGMTLGEIKKLRKK
jgi:hypothetical protein